MQARFFPHSAASRFGLLVLVAASLMLWLPATSASAQTQGDDAQYNTVCQNIIGTIGNISQAQTGTSTATAIDENAEEESADGTAAGEAADENDGGVDAQAETDAEEADAAVEQGAAVADRGVVAEVAQEQGVSIEQVNECLNGTDNGTTTDPTEDPTRTTQETEDPQEGVMAATIPDQKVLANTGGPALLLPALGVLLISSVAIRNILRR